MFRSGFARCPLDGTPLQQIEDDPLAGSIFVDRYVIDGLIGEGAMGRVYRAQHRRMSRKFAIKVLFGDHATDAKMRERFGREAESASRLSHANVISVIDFGETEEGLLYLVMEYVEGRELANIIDEQAPLQPDRIRRFMRQLCQGLGHAHDQGLVHRDFKAANVLVAGSGDAENCKIVDFGIAVLQESGGSARLTTEGIVLGTPAYMSPEQATGQELDLRTDLFSLGVLLYEMLCGVLPFEGPPVAVARQNLAVDPPRIFDRVPGLKVDPELEAIAHKLMAKKREQRYQTAAEILTVLEQTSVPIAAGALPSGPTASRSGPVVIATAPTEAAAALPDESATRTAADPAAVHLETQRVDAFTSRRRGLIAGLAILALLLAVGGYLVLRNRGDSDSQKAIAGPPPAAPDAGPIARVDPPDASVPVADPIDAGVIKPTGNGKRPVVRDAGTKPPPLPRDAGTRPPPPKVPDAAPTPAPAVTMESLTKLYVSVGAAVDKLERTKGADVAQKFRDKYMDIPFADAQRNASLRVEVQRALQKLKSDVNAALK